MWWKVSWELRSLWCAVKVELHQPLTPIDAPLFSPVSEGPHVTPSQVWLEAILRDHWDCNMAARPLSSPGWPYYSEPWSRNPAFIPAISAEPDRECYMKKKKKKDGDFFFFFNTSFSGHFFHCHGLYTLILTLFSLFLIPCLSLGLFMSRWTGWERTAIEKAMQGTEAGKP